MTAVEPLSAEQHLDGIRARQAGRHGPYGPSKFQEHVRTAAFLIARADIDKLLAELDQRDAEIARLHEALRERAIYKSPALGGWCQGCSTTWFVGDPELHEPGCLAAPAQEPAP